MVTQSWCFSKNHGALKKLVQNTFDFPFPEKGKKGKKKGKKNGCKKVKKANRPERLDQYKIILTLRVHVVLFLL